MGVYIGKRAPIDTIYQDKHIDSLTFTLMCLTAI